MPGPKYSELNDAYNLDYLEDQYAVWLQNPDAVDERLRYLYHGATFYGNGAPAFSRNGHPNGAVPHIDGQAPGQPKPLSGLPVDTRVQVAAIRMITAYRNLGHLVADSNPLTEDPLPLPFALTLERFGLTDADLNQSVDASMLYGLDGRMPLRDIVAVLTDTYCGTVGIEYMHIQEFAPRHWLAIRMEPTRNRRELTAEQRRRVLLYLRRAERFENYLQTKYLGKKRFGLEGGDSLIPMLDALIDHAPSVGVKEFVIGMAHRGRLNVLVNILRKPVEELFAEFRDPYRPDAEENDGDVKYHLGYSSNISTSSGANLHLTLTPNPSHLEAVNPLVQGRTRAKQRAHSDYDRTAGVPLTIHGDAAMAGQGIVPETLSMANLSGYRTGGTVHIVINNQIGFTTQPRDARSTQYCTDIAKFIQAPIFHVNGEDPEACARVAELAIEYRQEFKSDVVIDLLCYRKMGHNEQDDASVTQPVMARRIAAKYVRPETSTVTVSQFIQEHTDDLIAAGVTTAERVAADDDVYRAELDQAFTASESDPHKVPMSAFAARWRGLTVDYSHAPVLTGVSFENLRKVGEQLVAVPVGFQFHPKLQDKDEAGKYPGGDSPFKRAEDVRTRGNVDWGTAEALAFGSLLLEGHPIRLSGQDSRRATFSQRHAYFYDYETAAPYCPLANLPDGAAFDVFDSFLSEAAVLGFEYGYSLDDPNALVLWEAQYGDFVNGAQVILDQFITSAESKWNRSSGLVLLLPHGLEGNGPEHSSARLERFLQCCAEDNIQVGYFTTPAQYFHALRRQLKRNFRKPMVLMTPKSTLRTVTSPLSDLIDGRFYEVIDDATVNPAEVNRVLLCSGKIYHDLAAARTAGAVPMPDGKKVRPKPIPDAHRTAIVRVEQLYPWPAEQLKAVLNRYPNAVRYWVQEEAENNGAWQFVDRRLQRLGFPCEYIGRDEAASPACGSETQHKHEQANVVFAAFTQDAYQPVG